MAAGPRGLAAWLLVGSGLAATAWAQDDMDAILGGFDAVIDSIELAQEVPAFEPEDTADWALGGSLSSSASYNLLDHQSSTGTEYSGLSKLRLRATADLGYTLNQAWRGQLSATTWYDALYDLRDADYTPEVRRAYRWEADLQDAFIEGKLNDRWDLKLGRQVVNWGLADSLRVLDLLNPLDNLEPGLADIEDIRRSTGMLKLDRFSERWQLSLIAVPELRFSRNPPYGSDYYALTDQNGQAVRYRHEQPERFHGANWAVAVLGRFSGWDLSLNAARLWYDLPYLDVSGFDRDELPAALATFNDDVVLRHSRINSLGLGLQWAWGSWLLKHEARFLHRLHFTETSTTEVPGRGPTPLPSGNPRKNRYDALLGLEYFGLSNVTLGLEFAARYIEGFSAGLARSGLQRLRTETALRLSRDFLNQRLRTSLIAIRFDDGGDFAGASGGALYRANADYELGQALELSGGIILYSAGNQRPLGEFAANDRLFTALKWSF